MTEVSEPQSETKLKQQPIVRTGEDPRMLFIRNSESMRAAGGSEKGHLKTEYEVRTDANIVGEFVHGPFRLKIWEFPHRRFGEWRKLCLQTTETEMTTIDNVYYHGGWIQDEIVALASLGLRRRMKLGPLVRRDDKPLMLDLRDPYGARGLIDPDVVSGTANLSDLDDWFELVEGLAPKRHQSFMRATGLYARALERLEEEPELAYLNLVSAIETLAKDQVIEMPDLSELDARVARLVRSVQDDRLREELTNALLAKERFISRRFVSFVMEHMQESFWTDPSRLENPYGMVRKEDLPELLKRIYAQRSRALHEGEPFIATVVVPMPGEIDEGLSASHAGRRWDPDEFIPRLPFFERLVNHVLRTFVARHQAIREECAENDDE